MTESRTPRPVRYFVRDDDIGALTPAVTTFVEAFVARGIPVSYQIIPARLSAECADYLLAVERDHPGLIEFGQHGLTHQMMRGAKQLKREFGPEKSLDEQTADIAEGLRLLRARLGQDRDISLFTPPQHKFDRNTLLAAAAAGHRVFSAACYPTPHHRLAYALGRRLGLSSIRHHGISYHGLDRPEARLREISIAIAVDNGRAITCKSGDIPAALARAAARTDTVGLMFHHAVYADAPQELAAIVQRLAEIPPARFHRLGDLAEG
ncbi:MAG: DUF2334 domain-containing protein [Phenylobacterium sp.]|uniref:DUF2334 domain-containing protein n=1 Tax=Phenylobacterium sp. TaxID=1871053 RepID=UPI00273640A6|nr:DUF2334 domain-containing protein [Phenylobacterium sp.]MDP3748419.1 DUF2334 domain-containing protein [Phenylobacterium sp.]